MHTELQDIAQWITSRMPADMQGNDWQALQQTFPWYTLPYWLEAAEIPENRDLAAKAAISGGNQFLLHILLQPTDDAIATTTGRAQTNAPVGMPPLPAEKATEPTAEDEEIPVPDTAFAAGQDDPFDIAAEEAYTSAAPLEVGPSALEAVVTDAPFKPAIENTLAKQDAAGEQPDEELAIEAITDTSEKFEAASPLTETGSKEAVTADAAEHADTDGEDYPPKDEANANPPELGNLNLKGLAKMMHEPVAATDPLAASEPFHTIDYFASQGIKAEKPKENTPANHFDKQVKSFTEWLKTMKKLHYQPATAYTDPLVEKKARQSLQEGEIVTETMADVWVKQGNFSEAVKIYQKLMLIHPEKSHYFAALIKQVNQKL